MNARSETMGAFSRTTDVKKAAIFQAPVRFVCKLAIPTRWPLRDMTDKSRYPGPNRRFMHQRNKRWSPVQSMLYQLYHLGWSHGRSISTYPWSTSFLPLGHYLSLHHYVMPLFGVILSYLEIFFIQLVLPFCRTGNFKIISKGRMLGFI
jgi:hypothetical protein